MKSKYYSDEELVSRFKNYLVNNIFKNIRSFEKSCGQKNNVLSFNFALEEYYLFFESQKGQRNFSFYLEKPSNGLVKLLKEVIKPDSLNFNHEVFLKYPELREKLIRETKKYDDIFLRKYVGKTRFEKNPSNYVGVFAIVDNIKKIPYGSGGKFSGNFFDVLFDFSIRPVLLSVNEFKQNLKL